MIGALGASMLVGMPESGEVFVVPRGETAHHPDQLEAATRELNNLDWRLHGLMVVPVSQLGSSSIDFRARGHPPRQPVPEPFHPPGS